MKFGSFEMTRWRFIVIGCLFFATEASLNFSEYFLDYEDIRCEQGYYDSGREPGEPFKRGRASSKRFFLVDSQRHMLARYIHHSDSYPLINFTYYPGHYKKVWVDDRTVRTVCYARLRAVIPFLYEDVILTYADSPIKQDNFQANFEQTLSLLNISGIMNITYNFLIVIILSFAIPKKKRSNNYTFRA